MGRHRLIGLPLCGDARARQLPSVLGWAQVSRKPGTNDDSTNGDAWSVEDDCGDWVFYGIKGNIR